MNKVEIIHCRSCGRNYYPAISTAMSAQPIYKCAHCNSLNIRHATADETKQLSDAPIKYDGLKIFSV